MGALSIWQWLIFLLIVAMVFGTGKLKDIGKDLGSAVKGFKEGMREGEAPPAPPAEPPRVAHQTTPPPAQDSDVIDVQSQTKP